MDTIDDDFFDGLDWDEPKVDPPPVTPEEEQKLDKVISDEIMPAVTRFRLAHAANLNAAIKWDGGVRLECEDDVAAFYLRCFAPLRTVPAHDKRILVSGWNMVKDRPILTPWHEFSHTLLTFVCKVSPEKGAKFTSAWLRNDIADIIAPEFRDILDMVAAAAVKYAASHPVEFIKIPYRERKTIDSLMQKFRNQGEDFELSLARLAEAVKRMGFPVLTGISAAIAYTLDNSLRKAL